MRQCAIQVHVWSLGQQPVGRVCVRQRSDLRVVDHLNVDVVRWLRDDLNRPVHQRVEVRSSVNLLFVDDVGLVQRHIPKRLLAAYDMQVDGLKPVCRQLDKLGIRCGLGAHNLLAAPQPRVQVRLSKLDERLDLRSQVSAVQIVRDG